MTRVLADALTTALTVTKRVPHVHSFSRQGDDPFSGASLYRCRCGVVRPAF